MSPWINYHHLFYFKTIAEEGSVSKAATKLRIGQPTLSSQLKQFEDSLGVQLFERQHKRLILTEQGKIALDYSRQIFRMGSEMYEVLHDRIRPQKPSLHIGALDSVPKQIILQMCKQALKIAPCQITLSEGKSDEILRELLGHRIDLMVTNFLPQGSDAKGIVPKLLSRRYVGFFGAPSFKHLRENFPHSISGIPLVLPTFDSKLRQDLEHWATLNKIELNILAESQDISLKKLLATNGMGLIPTASHTVTGQVLRGELVEIGTIQGVSEELFILSGKRKIQNSIASQLMKTFIV